MDGAAWTIPTWELTRPRNAGLPAGAAKWLTRGPATRGAKWGAPPPGRPAKWGAPPPTCGAPPPGRPPPGCPPPGLGAANAAPVAKLSNKAAVLTAVVIFNLLFNTRIILFLSYNLSSNLSLRSRP